MRTERAERESLIFRLQERNKEITSKIEKLCQDLSLNQQVIRELQQEEELSAYSEEDEISFEYIKTDHKPKGVVKVKSDKKAEQKEGLEKARAWHLDRLRAMKRAGQ
jgi:glycerol-3-phosphate responsive antiterminator